MISLNCIFSFQSTMGGSFLYSSMSRRCSRQQPLLLNSVPQQREGSVHTNWQIVGKLLFLSYTNNRTLTLPPIHGNHLHKSSIENDTRYSIYQVVKMNVKFFEQDCEIRFRDTLNCDLTIPQVISLIGQGVAQKYHIFCSEIFNFQFTIFLTTLQCK